MDKPRKQINGILMILIMLTIPSIAGCGNLEKKLSATLHEKRVPEDTKEDQLNNLMDEYIHFKQKDNSVLEKIFMRAKEKFELDNSYYNRFRYILLLTFPGQKFSDQASALALLRNWPQEEKLPASLQNFKKFLIMRLEEEVRLRNYARDLAHQLANEKMNVETLQKKIEDIKDMEKTLIRRNLE